jgi:hypothetical protein
LDRRLIQSPRVSRSHPLQVVHHQGALPGLLLPERWNGSSLTETSRVTEWVMIETE